MKTLGIIILAVSLAFLGASAYVYVMNTQRTDTDGYVSSATIRITTDSPALVFSDHKFNMREEIPPILQTFFDPDDFVIERWRVDNNLGKEVFIGIASADKAKLFLEGIHYKEADDWDVVGGPWDMNFWVNTYQVHQGAEFSQQPLDSNVWLASGSGVEGTEYVKMLVSGDYWVVIMNVDGSVGLDVNLDVGYRTPIVLGLPSQLALLGIIIGIVGLLLLKQKRAKQ